MEKRWEILDKSVFRGADSVVDALLKNRGIKDRDAFFNPPRPDQLVLQLKSSFPDLDLKQLQRAVQRIKEAISAGEKITIWGDYDVDGISATALLWQSLRNLGAEVLPYIPDRFGEGYGLNSEGVRKLKEGGTNLIITVDSGITAVEEAKLARSIGVDLIITDHHLLPQNLPPAFAIVHTDHLCGTGIAWLLATQLATSNLELETSLDLVAVATVADLQPLLGVNRSLVKYGLEVLNRLQRPGLAALVEVSGLKPGSLGTYAAGWVLGPRINAVGRIRLGIEALRLLCTADRTRARQLAQVLNRANVERKALTVHTFDHAKGLVEGEKGLIVVYHDSWHEGIIGLVAGKMVEEYGRPAIVIARGEEFSKGSARSVNGLNIVDFLRTQERLLEDVGGHAAAAGFTVKTKNLDKLVSVLRKETWEPLSQLDPRPVVKIDLRLPLEHLSVGLVKELGKFAPHGVNNPDPIFLAEAVEVISEKRVGRERQHLKLMLKHRRMLMEAIWFGVEDKLALGRGQTVSLAYTPEIEDWEGKERVVLKVRDLKFS